MAYLDLRRFEHRLRARYQMRLKREESRPALLRRFFRSSTRKCRLLKITPHVEGADDDAHEEAGIHSQTGDLNKIR